MRYNNILTATSGDVYDEYIRQDIKSLNKDTSRHFQIQSFMMELTYLYWPAQLRWSKYDLDKLVFQAEFITVYNKDLPTIFSSEQYDLSHDQLHGWFLMEDHPAIMPVLTEESLLQTLARATLHEWTYFLDPFNFIYRGEIYDARNRYDIIDKKNFLDDVAWPNILTAKRKNFFNRPEGQSYKQPSYGSEYHVWRLPDIED